MDKVIIILAGNADQFFQYRHLKLEAGENIKRFSYISSQHNVLEKVMGVNVGEIRIIGTFFARKDSDAILSALRFRPLNW